MSYCNDARQRPMWGHSLIGRMTSWVAGFGAKPRQQARPSPATASLMPSFGGMTGRNVHGGILTGIACCLQRQQGYSIFAEYWAQGICKRRAMMQHSWERLRLWASDCCLMQTRTRTRVERTCRRLAAQQTGSILVGSCLCWIGASFSLDVVNGPDTLRQQRHGRRKWRGAGSTICLPTEEGSRAPLTCPNFSVPNRDPL